MSEISWTPKRRLKLYCSPGCGGGCTWKAYVDATKKAERLASRLGDSWTPRVWENLGWHYSALDKTECIKVHPCGLEYMAYIGEKGLGGRWVHTDTSPRKAVQGAQRLARKERDSIQDMLTAIGEAP